MAASRDKFNDTFDDLGNRILELTA
jgi:hypothetical protein